MGDKMDRFVGKWEVTGTENMDEMLKVLSKLTTFVALPVRH